MRLRSFLIMVLVVSIGYVLLQHYVLNGVMNG
jgi:hypothetical protein